MNAAERMNFEINKRLSDVDWDQKMALQVRTGVKARRMRGAFIASTVAVLSVLLFLTVPLVNGEGDSQYDLVSYQVKNTVATVSYSSPGEAVDFEADGIDTLISSTLEIR
jgi:hypothetical protein